MNIFDLVVVQPILNLLIGLYSIIPGGDFGVSLIIFTVLVRFALFPLLKRQLHQSRAMQKLQPELVKIKKQAKGNKQLEGMMMMELYKKNDVSLFGQMRLLLIQLPIFIGLYSVIKIFALDRDQIGKFTYGFMQHIGPIQHLIQHPDQFNEKLFGVLDLTKVAISAHGIDIFLFALAIIAAVTQYFMSKQIMPKNQKKKRIRDILAEASEGKQADNTEIQAAMMQKMTLFFPFMMFFIMVSLPGALALYYTVSNLVAVGQQAHLLRQDEDELEALADEPVAPATTHKKATAKARAKVAKNATITRIKASPSAAKED